MRAEINRRSMLKIAGTAAGAATVAAAVPAAPASAAGAVFTHPGLLHTRADLDRMAAKVKAGTAPYKAGFAKLTANRHAQSTWTANPQATVYRGLGTPENYRTLYNDIHAAYQNALRWHVTGDTAHADTAVAILNAWSAKLTSLESSADRFLAAGLYGYQFANAAELVRDQKMMLDVFHPLSDDFLENHNNAVVSNYWANWDLTAIACVLAVGILCDDRAKVDRAVRYSKHGEGMGSIKNAIPVVHSDGLAEWVEAGRDQGHALLGVGLMGTVCEMAWNQGIDLYGYDDSRFLKGAQYVAKWSMGHDVPYTANTRRKGALNGWSGSETASEAAGVDPNMVRPIWAMIANHYTKRKGLSASYSPGWRPRRLRRAVAATTAPTAADTTNSASAPWPSPATVPPSRRARPPPPLRPRPPPPPAPPPPEPPPPHRPRPPHPRAAGTATWPPQAPRTSPPGRPPPPSPPSRAACSCCAAAPARDATPDLEAQRPDIQ